MKREWEIDELVEHFSLSGPEMTLLHGKTEPNPGPTPKKGVHYATAKIHKRADPGSRKTRSTPVQARP